MEVTDNGKHSSHYKRASLLQQKVLLHRPLHKKCLHAKSNTLHADGGSSKANWRKPKSCLGLVFNFKLGCFTNSWPIQTRPSLNLKTRPRFGPDSLSLSVMLPKVEGCSKEHGINLWVRIHKTIFTNRPNKL
jgi:hypothetical protein